MARVSGTIGVEQKSPMRTPGVAKVAVSAATARSHAADQLATGGGRDALHLGDHRLRRSCSRSIISVQTSNSSS